MSSSPEPVILITNDDGIYSPGLMALVKSLADLGEIHVVAPMYEMSAMGHAITLSDPLKVSDVERGGAFFGYGIHGTPADCVKLAVNSDLVPRPALVVSGINRGANLGIDIIYSGTVSAAYEGTLMGVPSMAVSLASFTSRDFEPAAGVARNLARQILQNGLPAGTLLNINVPEGRAEDWAGILSTRQGTTLYNENYERRLDPRQRVYYWLAGNRPITDGSPQIDELAVAQRFVSVTPLHYRLTDMEFLDDLRSWNLSGETHGE